MVACVAGAVEALPTHNSFRRRFDSTSEGLCIFQKCRSFKQLKQIHAHIIKKNLTHNQILTTKLISLCSSYGKMDYAGILFNQIKNPLTFTWNTMIRGYTMTGSCLEGIHLYNLMIVNGYSPDKFTFPFVIKACSKSFAIEKGKEVHACVLKTGFLNDMFVQHTLMDLYFKCGELDSGRKVFDGMRVKNVVSWTTILSGLVAKGELEAAHQVFEMMPIRNVVSWTAMINGYARNGMPQQAFELFGKMQIQNIRPNEFTLISLLSACTDLGSLRLGEWIHEFAHKNGFQLSIYLGTSLIDMYSNCGSLEDAIKVFEKMPQRSIATWNSMITSLGVHGRGKEAVSLFEEMEKQNISPDGITFIGVLCACMHGCMVDDGYKYFRYMNSKYDISPSIEHYLCLVQLLCRAGRLDEAYELITNMSMKPDVHVWGTLLRACKSHGYIELEEIVHKHIKELDSVNPDNSGNLAHKHDNCFDWDVG